MFSNFAFSAAILLSLFQTISARRNVWSTTANGLGASIQLKDTAATETGFNAKFYSYPALDFIPFWNDDFVADGYSTRQIITSANGITDPNFSFDSNMLNEQVYGLYNIDMFNVLIELKGYFKRMY